VRYVEIVVPGECSDLGIDILRLRREYGGRPRVKVGLELELVRLLADRAVFCDGGSVVVRGVDTRVCNSTPVGAT
jgi:hypothetical protein